MFHVEAFGYAIDIPWPTLAFFVAALLMLLFGAGLAIVLAARLLRKQTRRHD
jgi:hypothetical protein